MKMIIRKLRLEKGWSQEQLAEMAGVSTRTIQRIERGGQASLETKKCLAAVFEINLINLQKDQKDNDMSDDKITQDERAALNKMRRRMKDEGDFDQSLSSEEREAMEYVRDIKSFYINFGTYVIVMVFLLILNLLNNPSNLWVIWPALGWGVGVAFHALSVFEIFSPMGGDWEKRQIEKRLKRK